MFEIRGRVFVAVLLAGLSFTIVHADGAPPEPNIKTDRGIYPLPPAPALPKAGGTFIDPTFGTEILRVTDETDGKENVNAYSYYPSFNKDSTMFFVAMRGSPTLYHFDPIAFKITGKEKLYAKKPPSNYDPRWEDSIWSGKDPNVIFCHQGLNLWRYDVPRKVYTLVKDFSKELPPGHLAQMSKSLDDNVFGFSRQEPKWKLVGYLVWRQDTDKILLREDTTELDEIQVDKTGKYCVIKSDRQGKGVVQVRVADLNTGKIENLIDDAPDYAPGHSDNGHGTVVGMDNWKNRVTFRRLATPHEFYSVLDHHNDWSQDCHISMLADDESWALLSFYTGNKLPSSGIFKDEIVRVSTDGKQTVRRLAHHRSVVKQYWDSPRANISRDGRFVTYTSNWEGTGQRDVFILKVPPLETTSTTAVSPPAK
jgi:hypothetical protein